jgi:hypothetical protein
MKHVKFIIVENEAPDYKSTRQDLLSIGATPANIWPPNDSDLFKSWPQVGTTLKHLRDSGWSPEDATVVLILDLALDSNDEDFERGVQAITSGHAFYRDYATVLCTRAAPRVGTKLAKIVDGVFHKVQETDFEIRQARFAKTVRIAIRSVEKRAKKHNTLTIDSFANIRHNLSFLAFVSAYSEDILLELVEAISENSALVAIPTVVVASGGYSGATVLLFEYRTQRGGSRQVAVKISRDQELLQEEVAKLKEVHKASHKFDDLPIPLVHGVKVLPGYPDIFFVQQHYVNGRTLEAALIDSEVAHNTHPIIEALRIAIGELVSCGLADSHTARLSSSIIVSDRLRLTYREVSKQVRTGLRLLDSHTAFKTRFGLLLSKMNNLDRVVDEWTSFCESWSNLELPFYEQHGDLNVRNILILGENDRNLTLRLIDFARFGSWPAFYDLTRLRLQIALRVLDPSPGMRDIFPERILLWDKAFWGYERPEGIRKSHPKEFQHFVTFIDISKMLDSLVSDHSSTLKQYGKGFKTSMKVIMLNEVIRLICYDDVPWTKRIWFTLLAARLVEELGMP